MGTEANKEIVRQFLRALGENRLDDADALIAKDAQYWVLGAGDVEIEFVKSYWPRMFGSARGPETMKVVVMTAEDDRVAVEMIGNVKLPDGRDYRNTYHSLFCVRDGRITKVREYIDTAYTETIFGNAAQRDAAWSAERPAPR